MAAISDYELQRQEKIAKNQALLRQLQLDADQAGLAPSARRRNPPAAGSAAPSKKRKRQTAEVKAEDNAPRRTSARLQGIVADSEVARQKEEKDVEAFQEQQRARRQRVSDDINLGDALVTGRHWDRAGNWLSAVGPARAGERTFTADHVRATSDKELRALRERMSGLRLWPGADPQRIKITPERVYSMAFHPAPDKALVFAGDKLGNLGLFDASQTAPAHVKAEADDDDDEDDDKAKVNGDGGGEGDGGDDDDEEEEFEPAITTFKIHTRTISAMHFAPHDPTALYSASYDSSVRKLDLHKGTAVEVYAPADREADEPLSGVELSPTDAHTLHFTTLDGRFGMHDLRAPAHRPAAAMMQLSDKKIGGFSLHPAHPHLLATASLDRTLKLWDLRHLTRAKGGDAAATRMPLLLGSHESKLSVSHAAFNGAGQIATTSYDDTVKIHDVSALTSSSSSSKEPSPLEPTTIIPHNNQTGRWVTILRAQWQRAPEDAIPRFAIGNMNRFVDVYTASGRQLAQLGGDGVTAVPAVAVFHPSRDWVAGGTASGKLCLWM